MIAGLLILSVEAPNLFTKVGFMSFFNERIGKRPYWIRAVFYILIMIPALVLCTGFMVIIPSILVFILAALYGVMSFMHT